jgi:hypothetical protein
MVNDHEMQKLPRIFFPPPCVYGAVEMEQRLNLIYLIYRTDRNATPLDAYCQIPFEFSAFCHILKSEVNPENLHLCKKLEKETGIRLVGLGPDSFAKRAFEFGTLANPDAGKGEQA